MNRVRLDLVWLGLVRGGIELRHVLTSPSDLVQNLFFPMITLVVLVFLRGHTVAGASVSLGALALPGVLGMIVAVNGLAGLAGPLIVEHEDGTLLRAKAVPGGMTGYLAGKITMAAALAVAGVIVVLVPGLVLFPGVAIGSAGSWLTLAWVIPLGLLATLPLGVILGSLVDSPAGAPLITLALSGLVAISGIFYPISHLPVWLRTAGQVFPVYWVGLGMRSALLHPAMAAVEIGGSWRHAQTALILAAWAVAGLLAAPVVLRRMARRESGSRVAARLEKRLQRVG